MKTTLTLFIIALLNTGILAQPDTLQKEQNPIVEVYDVVAVNKTSTDGRGRTYQYVSELKGKILNYDESTGVLSFKGRDGKIYSFKNTDYKYFEYDKEFTTKTKKVEILPRKDSGYEFGVGLSFGYFNISHDFTPDAYYLNGFESSGDIPISLRLGVSKYLNKNSSVGLTGEYALIMDDNNYFNIGARYQYIYNPSKNSAFYFPVELKYSRYQFVSQYQTSDTIYADLGWQYPSQLNTEVAVNALELNIGQGVSFALKNKKSLSLELLLFKQFVMSQSIKSEKEISPKSEFGINGLKLSLMMNF